MPTIQINSEVLEFNNIYYVDPVGGLDTNDGSKSNPFKTVNYAVSVCASSGDAIYAVPGIHDVTRLAGSSDSGGLSDTGKAISFIGAKGKTTFLCDGSKHSGRDTHAIMFSNAGTKAYQIIFDQRVAGRTTNYTVSICGVNYSSPVRGEVINCHIKSDANSPSLNYSNDGSSTIKFKNCYFEVKAAFQSSYSGLSTSFVLENTMSNFAFGTGMTKINTYENILFDAAFRSNSIKLNSGYYSGAFAWSTDKYLFRAFNKNYAFSRLVSWYNTAMTSNSAPAPFVASASSVYSTTYDAWRAFNGQNNDVYSWISANGVKVGWLQIGLNAPKKVNHVVITTRNDPTGVQAAPKDFNILGSNDGVNFVTLSEVRNETNWKQNESRTYQFKNHKAHLYYRIDVLSNNGGNYVAIGELLFGYLVSRAVMFESTSVQSFDNYGSTDLSNLDAAISEVDYVSQSLDASGIRSVEINRKPSVVSIA